jgi:hypothetical protein
MHIGIAVNHGRFELAAQPTGALKGTWAHLLHPPIEGRLARGIEGMDVDRRLSVQRIRTDVDRGYTDFARQGVQ